MRKRKPGKWQHSRIFEDVGVALDNNVTPSVFWNEWPNNDQAYAIARGRAVATMTAWEDYLHEREMAKHNKAKK